MTIEIDDRPVYRTGSAGESAYVRRREGDVARSSAPHEAVTLDFDAEDNLIGVEVLASPRGSG